MTCPLKIPHWSQDLSDTDVPSAAGLDKYINVSHAETLKMLLYSSIEYMVWMFCSVKQTFLGKKKKTKQNKMLNPR